MQKRIGLKKEIFIVFGILVTILLAWRIVVTLTSKVTSSAWDGVVSIDFSGGNGSENNPYIIGSAGDYAYFKSLMESSDASVYADKYYKITNSFDYNNYDISINNDVAFSGVIDGNYNYITKALVTDSMFKNINGGTIKNLELDSISVNVKSESGSVIATNSESSTYSFLVIESIIEKDQDNEELESVSGFLASDNSSIIDKVIVHPTFTDIDSSLISEFITTSNGTVINNAIVKNNGNDLIKNNINTDITNLKTYTVQNNNVVIDNEILNSYKTSNYEIVVEGGEFTLNRIEPTPEEETTPSYTYTETSGASFIPVHKSGVENGVVYVNDLEADYNYYKGLNYTTSTNGRTPTQLNKNLYTDSNLTKVEIIYDSVSLGNNNSTIHNGKVSYESGEAQTKFVYYKYYSYNTSTNKLDIELIDNPFSGRPNDMAFNGWYSDNSNIEVYLDNDLYTYHAVIDVDPSKDFQVVSLRTSWTNADMEKTSDNYQSIDDTLDNLKTAGIHELHTKDIEYIYHVNLDDYPNGLYTRVTLDRYDYQYGYYSETGTALTGYCNSRNGCTVYERVENDVVSQNTTFYTLTNGRMTVTNADITREERITRYDNNYINMNMANFYQLVHIDRGSSINGYYNASGVKTTGNCTTNGGCDVYHKILFNEMHIYDLSNTYYYLTTRDTNIVYLDSNVTTTWTSTKPFTLTSYYNGTDSRNNSYFRLYYSTGWYGTNTYIRALNDTRIEYVRLYSTIENSTTAVTSNNNSTGGLIYGNSNNLKIGRGLTQNDDYVNARMIVGTANTNDESPKYRLIVESGVYSFATTGGIRSGVTLSNYDIKGTYGCDYDRVTNDNSNLDIYATLYGDRGTAVDYGNSNDVHFYTIVKSGRYGSNGSITGYTLGIYATSNSSGVVSSPMALIVEGGYIHGINGGPGPDSSLANNNGAYIYIKGGEINTIFGGGAYLTSYSNRILQITGGTINNSVFGGSNGYMYGTGNATGTNARGILNGDTYLYIGGNTTIGVSGSTERYDAEIGSVFGIGNGKSGYDYIGTANNSYIIIDGDAKILNNVYAGGNYGTVGYNSTSDVLSSIKVIGGTINGSVFGAGNNNGAGTSSVDITTTIELTSGTIKDSIYGGSNISGNVYGTSNVYIKGGEVKNVFGGGYGANTGVRDNVLVEITNGKINNSIYGGSAFGTVNGLANGTTGTGETIVNIKGGTILKNVFGGGMGSSNQEPHTYKNITINISNGSMGNVFGGHDLSGTVTTTDTINITGGTIGNVFGGGNESSVNTTNINMSAGNVNGSIYGGSNNSGTVNTSNIHITGTSKIGNIYGGNNLGGTFGTSNIIIDNGTIVNSIYGGGNNVDSNSTNITLNNGSTKNVFGGGKSASILNNTSGVNIIQNGIAVNNIYGGSDSSGTVSKVLITHNSGNTLNIYGGNNAGGVTNDTTINYINGTTTNIYGGGNFAETGNILVNIQNGTITNVYGGGNSAGADSSNVNVVNGIITNVYGGSNNEGLLDETNVGIAGGTITNVFGGGNLASVGDSNIIVNNGTIGTLYGGGNMASSTSTNVDINGGTINNNIYGGGNFGTVDSSTYVNIENGRIKGSCYAGGNGASATVLGDTVIEIGGSTIIGTESDTNLINSSVFGGGNAAATGTSGDTSHAIVNIAGGTIYGNVYGGANTSVINGIAEVRIGKNAITSKDNYNTLNNTASDITIKGTIFGGGEANAEGSEIFDYDAISVTKGIDILIDGSEYNNLNLYGSIFGSGDASRSDGYSYITIKNYGTFDSPHRNLSIQRTQILTIDNSNVLLIGQKDRTNEYSDVLFSLSRIEDLKLVNNSSLFLEEGTNLLEKFESLDADGNKARVTINEDTKEVTKTVDNRLYVLEGKIVNIALDQQVTDYGEVSGMTFFGMYKHGGSNNLNLGIYKKNIEYGSTINLGDLPTKGSYVLGLHNTNHNIEVDGFYSNFQDGDDTSTLNKVDYINPTPESSTYYMWIIGEAVIEYNIDLVASKYSTLGSLELGFLEFSNPNTSFQILGFDSSGLEDGVNLKDSNEIAKIAQTEDEANNNYAITMSSSNTGWLTNGKTTFLSQNSTYTGTNYYIGDNTSDVPSMLFQLYHAKNLTVDRDLGTVVIQLMAIEKKNALESETKRVVINVNLSTDLYTDINYEGAMTPGDKYEIFPSTSTTITDKSKFSSYFSLFITDDTYYNKKCTSGDCYRTLISTYALPKDTKITMIDKMTNKYYYYIVSETDYNNAVTNINNVGETTYNLSLFKSMGTDGIGVNYNDTSMNSIYSSNGVIDEEFIFIFDFKDTEITGNQLNKYLSFELRSGNNTITSVLGVERDNLKYSLYDNVDTSLEIDGSLDTTPLYISKYGNIDLNVAPKVLKQGSINIYNTEYFDYKLGISIKVKNSDGEYISGNALTGLYYEVDGISYYPDINGVARIKIADKVGSIENLIKVNLENASLPTGTYTFEITAFGSIDGIYYSNSNLVTKNISTPIINSTYGLKVDIDDESVTINTNDENNKLTGKVSYTSLLDNPNIRMKMYRRNYNQIYESSYTLVDLSNYITTPMERSSNINEYYLSKIPTDEIALNFNFKDNIITGTYRLDFILYDNNVEIGTISRYIIIHDSSE